MKEPITLEIIDFNENKSKKDNKSEKEDKSAQMICEDGVCKI